MFRPTSPRTRFIFVSLLLLAAHGALSGCNRSPADQLIERSIEQLEAAERLLEENAPDPIALKLAVMDYRREHRDALRKLRTDGDAVLAGMDEAARKRLSADSRTRSLSIITRIDNLVKRYPKPRNARVAVQPLVAQATPRPKRRSGTFRPWAPPLPPATHDHPPADTPAPVTPPL